jgi:hypothetical protein
VAVAIREEGIKRVEIKHREIREGETKRAETQLGEIKVVGTKLVGTKVAGRRALQVEVEGRSVGPPLRQQKSLGQYKFLTWMLKKWWIRLR